MALRRFRVVCVLLLLATAGAGGCRSGPALRSQRDCDQYRPLADAWSALGLEATCVPTTDRLGRVAPIAVYRGGNPDALTTIVFLHGVFSDHESWRFVAADLAEDHRIVLVDLLGCGASAGDFETGWYDQAETFGLDALADRTLQAVAPDVDDGRRGARTIIAAHSMGGAIALRLFASGELSARYASTLAHVDGLFLVAPLDVAIEKADPALAKVATINGLELAIGQWTGELRRVVTRTVGESVGPHAVALREEADKRMEILLDGRKRRATQAMLRLAVQSQDRTRFKPDWEWISDRTAETRRVDEPSLILWGEQDETLPASMGYKLWALLARSELVIFRGVKHSPHLEHPAAVADLLRRFAAPGSTMARTPHERPERLVDPSEPGDRAKPAATGE